MKIEEGDVVEAEVEEDVLVLVVRVDVEATFPVPEKDADV